VIATNEKARVAGLKAGDLVKAASKILGGGGGGGADLAQGGGQDPAKIDAALASVVSAVEARA
jgi:alanyl-tRNA synthetase